MVPGPVCLSLFRTAILWSIKDSLDSEENYPVEMDK